MTSMKPSRPKLKKKSAKAWVYFAKKSQKAKKSLSPQEPFVLHDVLQDVKQCDKEVVKKQHVKLLRKKKKRRKRLRKKDSELQASSVLDSTSPNNITNDIKDGSSEKKKSPENQQSSVGKALCKEDALKAKHLKKKEKRKLKKLARRTQKKEKTDVNKIQRTNDLLRTSNVDCENQLSEGSEISVGTLPQNVSRGKSAKTLGTTKAGDSACTAKTQKRKRKAAKNADQQGEENGKKRRMEGRDEDGPNSGRSSRTATEQFPEGPEEVASNWKALMSKLKPTNSKQRRKKDLQKNEIQNEEEEEVWFDGVDPSLLEVESKVKAQADRGGTGGNTWSTENNKLTKCVGLDCEMVGTGHEGKESILARVSMVNEYGHCIYDKFVKPREKVTDYRTAVSGVRPADLFRGTAEEFLTVQKEVAAIMKDRLLVGHALKNDMKVLFLGHPRKLMRDTATYKPFREIMKTKRPSLKKLAKTVLGVTVQEGEHSSVEDAQAAMRLYTLHKAAWEKAVKLKGKVPQNK